MRRVPVDYVDERPSDPRFLHLDVDPHVWGRLEHLVERGHRHALPAKGVATVEVLEAVRGIQAPDLLERVVGDQARAVRRPVEGRVVEDDDVAVTG